MAANTEYTKIKESTISAFFSKLKAAFWHKTDVVNITLADVAVSGDYEDLSNTPVIPTVPTISTDIMADKSSNDKTTSPKATYDNIYPAIGSSQPSGGFLPNKPYDIGEISGNVTFSLASPSDANIANHYYFAFDTGATAPTITWPANISWVGTAPDIIANKHYEISIIDGVGVWMEA